MNLFEEFEQCAARCIIYILGIVTVFILAALFLLSMEVEEEQMCKSESGHKEVPCD